MRNTNDDRVELAKECASYYKVSSSTELFKQARELTENEEENLCTFFP